jgi:hypothetical protein
MTAEIIDKLQEKATVLTQERKKRGKTVPEVSITHLSFHPCLHYISKIGASIIPNPERYPIPM